MHLFEVACYFYLSLCKFCECEWRYGDSVDSPVEENSGVFSLLPCGKPIIWAHWASFALLIIGVLKYSLDIEDATV